MKYLIALILTVVGALAIAQNVANIKAGGSWTAPVEREDGRKFDAKTELGGYVFRYKKKSEPAAAYVESRLTPDKLNIELTLPTGTYEFAVQAFDKDGLYSNWLTLPDVVAPSAPKAPGNFKVIVTPERLVIQSSSK